MDCAAYRKQYPKFQEMPVDTEAMGSPEYEAHCDHGDACRACDDWTMARKVRKRGARVDDHPCVHIAYHVTAKLASTFDDPFEDPDVVIWKLKRSGAYGIPVRDGGSSIIAIRYCPWCGVALGEPE